MKESPLFTQLKEEGKTSLNPIKESFGHKENFKMVLLALFGATMGQGVIWYTSQFYAQSFILTKCNVEYEQANSIIMIALLLATPFFIVFGALSDKWGRKNIMLLGMLLGVLLYRPIFQQLYSLADTSGKEVITNTVIEGQVGSNMKVPAVLTNYTDGTVLKVATTTSSTGVKTTKEVVLNANTKWKMILLVTAMVLFVTMVYGPIAAFLVEMFPTRIRYTSMSLPYHIGNGVFGGLVPFIATLITTIPGTNYLSGLWYPIGVAALCLVVGGLYLSNKIEEHVTDEVAIKPGEGQMELPVI
jgi:MFS family permease